GGGGGSGGIGRLGDTLAGALLGGCVIAPGRFRLGVLGQDWNSSLADASARRAGGGLVWEGCAGCACLAAMPRSGGTAAASGRPDPPTLAPGSWRRQAAPGEQGPAVQAPSVAGEWVACRAAQAARVLSIIWVSWPFPTAPTWVAWTWPSLNSSSIGIERTWYLIAVARFWSMLTLATLTRPS